MGSHWSAAAAAAAEPAASSQVESSDTRHTDADAAGAVFSPFASIDVASPPPGQTPAAVQQGDWIMPIAAALFGMVCIVVLLRKLVS